MMAKASKDNKNFDSASIKNYTNLFEFEDCYTIHWSTDGTRRSKRRFTFQIIPRLRIDWFFLLIVFYILCSALGFEFIRWAQS